jgi:hypothetical protein
MADRDFLLHPERWRDRAESTRSMARNAHETQDRERLLKTARGYDRLAARAEDWKAAREQQI